MKCPKCGYNSFEIHDICKKCANDLTSYKNIHGLKSIVIPLETRTIMAEKLMADRAQEEPAAAIEAPADMFSFDIPEGETNAVTPTGDPFDFGTEPTSPVLGGGDFSFSKEQMSAQAKAEEEAFADLLESSSKAKGSTPSTPQSAESQDQDGIDLSNFTWDDTPDTAPGEVSRPAGDDFNTLFGDTDDSALK
jgi:hypothetical protein